MIPSFPPNPLFQKVTHHFIQTRHGMLCTKHGCNKQGGVDPAELFQGWKDFGLWSVTFSPSPPTTAPNVPQNAAPGEPAPGGGILGVLGGVKVRSRTVQVLTSTHGNAPLDPSYNLSGNQNETIIKPWFPFWVPGKLQYPLTTACSVWMCHSPTICCKRKRGGGKSRAQEQVVGASPRLPQAEPDKGLGPCLNGASGALHPFELPELF